MKSTKQINIKDRTYYFYNDIIDIKTFDSNNLKLDKKRTKILIFTILDMVQLKKLVIVNSVNPLYLRFDNASGYIKEKGSNKYLVLDSTDENKELLNKCSCVFDGLIDKIKKIDDDRLVNPKDYTKIKFSSDDNLPLKKPLKFYDMTVTIRCVISEENKLYPQLFSDDTLYSL